MKRKGDKPMSTQQVKVPAQDNGSPSNGTLNPKTPTKIHKIDGEKGGVGKSLFARTLMHYCLEKKLDVTLVDADLTNPDVAEVYSEQAKKITFSENERKFYDADQIFDLAFEKSVLINLPAQVYPLVCAWIERNNLIELGKQCDIHFVKWFVCTGAYDSVKLFLDSVEYFQSSITHVLVQNMGLCDDWSHVDERADLKEVVKKYGIQKIKFPKLSYRERDKILEGKLTFWAARESESLKILGKQRVVNFLKEAFAEIEKVNLLP
jgi:hypothetical protein